MLNDCVTWSQLVDLLKGFVVCCLFFVLGYLVNMWRGS